MRPEDLKKHLPESARILLIKLRSIGDVIYNTAMYAPIKRCWPKSHLTVMVEAASLDLVRDHPDVDEVFCFPRGSLVREIGAYARLLFGGYDLVLDMHGGPRSSVMGFLTRARFRAGYAGARRSFLYSLPVSFGSARGKNTMEDQAMLLSHLGIGFDSPPRPEVHISAASRERAEALLAGQNLDGEAPFMVLHPGARENDQWPPENFAAVADALYRRHGFAVLFTCGPGQEHQVERVRACVKEARSGFVVSGLQEIAAISARAKLVLCHNGGYMHLAALAGAPVVGLFGGASVQSWTPPMGRTATLHKALECYPCNGRTMRQECRATTAECKGLISVEEVLQAAEKFLMA